MAGSRLEKVGSIYTRVRDLISSGVMKKKPLWFDVFQAFPPKKDPLFVKPLRFNFLKKQPLREIFYREDEIRAKFYEQYLVSAQALDLAQPSYVSQCQRFVDKFLELKSRGELEESALFEATGKALLSEGIVLRRKRSRAVAAESKDPVLNINLSFLLEEQQTEGADNMRVDDTTLADTRPTVTEPSDSKTSGGA